MSNCVEIRVPSYGYTYTFSGVLSIKHELTLKIRTDSESATGTDYVNGARNQPDKVILSVMETDVGHISGWADRMLQAMEALQRTRTLRNVVTAARTYSAMLLSGFEATYDETSQSGWQGTLTFTQYIPPAEPEKTDDNASTATHTGTVGTVQTVTSSPLAQMLARAGIAL